MILSTDFFTNLRPSKLFTNSAEISTKSDQSKPQNSLDFDASGDNLVVACGANDSIQLFNCASGEKKSTIFSKKYGVGQIRFAHRSTTVIYTSSGCGDETIRYLSLHDNKYLRYFRGHTRPVRQLCLSPLNDTFLSVAPEEALCLWDLRTAHMQGRLNFTGPASSSSALAAFDPQGLVFAVATGSKYLRLYDARNWDRGAFTTFEISGHSSDSSIWNHLSFSPSGKEILIGTGLNGTNNSSVAVLLDSFDGNLLTTLDAPNSATLPNASISYPSFTFSPDSKFILGGRSDGGLDIWSNSSASPVVDTVEGSGSPIGDIAFNPKYAMVASASTNGTVFYI